MGEGNIWFVLNISGNSLVALYRKLPMGRKDTGFGVKYQNLFLTRHLLNYKELFVGTTIYIRYVVITIVLFTSMISIELFYFTQKI